MVDESINNLDPKKKRIYLMIRPKVVSMMRYFRKKSKTLTDHLNNFPKEFWCNDKGCVIEIIHE